MGFYTVYVKDMNGCGIAKEDISVLGAPKFFTPNGDGYNDYWNIRGANFKFYPKSYIRIFGKIVKQITAVGDGWDGTYKGAMLPADDYWYVIYVDNGRIAKGHFSLLR